MSEELITEDGRIKVYITYREKTVLLSANPKSSLKVTMDNLIKLSNNDPEKFWNLPGIDSGGQRIAYYLGKQESKTILHSTGNTGGEQTMEDYGVKAGDHLRIIQKVVAG